MNFIFIKLDEKGNIFESLIVEKVKLIKLNPSNYKSKYL